MNLSNSYDEDKDSQKDMNYEEYSNFQELRANKDNSNLNPLWYQKTNPFTNEISINTNSDIGKIDCLDNQEKDFNILNEYNSLYFINPKDLEYNGINQKNVLIQGCKEKIYEEKKEIETKEKPKIKRFTLKKTSRYGRKTDIDKKNGKKGNHTKDKEDNIISKIKSNFQKYFHKFLLNCFQKKEDLLKMNNKVIKSLKKDNNLELFKKTLKEIFIQEDISKKYKNKEQDANVKLINKIYEENKEKEVIKILNLTYLEVFDIFRRKLKDISPELKEKVKGTKILDTRYFKDAETFIKEQIKKREKKDDKKEEIDKYIEDIKRLILEFESWFENKISRRKKKKKINLQIIN